MTNCVCDESKALRLEADYNSSFQISISCSIDSRSKGGKGHHHDAANFLPAISAPKNAMLIASTIPIFVVFFIREKAVNCVEWGPDAKKVKAR